MSLAKRRKLEFQIKAILPAALTEHPKFENVYISKLKQKQHISKLMQALSKDLPLPLTLHQLKRVRQNEVLICRKTDLKDSQTLEEYLNSYTTLNKEIIELICNDVDVIEVPTGTCKLRWQYDLMRDHWPCKFHPNKYLESLYDSSIFTENDIEFHKKIKSLLQQISKEVGDEKPFGICVDPRTDSIVAMATSRNDLNPIYHCPMVLVDFVARTQQPSTWNTKYNAEFIETPHENGSKESKAGILKTHFEFIKQNESFKHLKLGSEIIKQKEKIKADCISDTGLDNLAKYGPYLCTGYDVYLTQEPCLMCSMALVHSRVKRIFFLHESKSNGALLTHFQLHSVAELNHHYEVFQFS